MPRPNSTRSCRAARTPRASDRARTQSGSPQGCFGGRRAARTTPTRASNTATSRISQTWWLRRCRRGVEPLWVSRPSTPTTHPSFESDVDGVAIALQDRGCLQRRSTSSSGHAVLQLAVDAGRPALTCGVRRPRPHGSAMRSPCPMLARSPQYFLGKRRRWQPPASQVPLIARIAADLRRGCHRRAVAGARRRRTTHRARHPTSGVPGPRARGARPCGSSPATCRESRLRRTRAR
jgi:hypothetical protein